MNPTRQGGRHVTPFSGREMPGPFLQLAFEPHEVEGEFRLNMFGLRNRFVIHAGDPEPRRWTKTALPLGNLFTIALTVLLLALPASAGLCTGKTKCTACVNCSKCRHCRPPAYQGKGMENFRRAHCGKCAPSIV